VGNWMEQSVRLPRVGEKAEGIRTRFKGILGNIGQQEEVVFANQAIHGFYRSRGFTRGVLREY
jgi:hypothetical protein